MHIIDPEVRADRDPVPNFEPEAKHMSGVDFIFWRSVT